jgi:hypothetical protein
MGQALQSRDPATPILSEGALAYTIASTTKRWYRTTPALGQTT